jgi:hypothetical protein
MKTPLLLLCVISTYFLNAQINWLDTGQQWKYCYVTGWLGPEGCNTLTVEGDTLLAGHLCKKMHWSDGNMQYAYEVSDKIFVSSDGITFTKVYDFDMIEGEILDAGNFSYQVDSIFTTTLDSFSNVRVQKAHVFPNSTYYAGISSFFIIEGIGILRGFQPEFEQCICGAFFPGLISCEYALDGTDVYLVSFQQGSKVFKPSGNSCFGTINTNEQLSGVGLQIDPNPFATTCRIKHSFPDSEGTLLLFNYSGSMLQQWNSVPESLDLTGYPSGIYFLTYYRDGHMVCQNTIVKG